MPNRLQTFVSVLVAVVIAATGYLLGSSSEGATAGGAAEATGARVESSVEAERSTDESGADGSSDARGDDGQVPQGSVDEDADESRTPVGQVLHGFPWPERVAGPVTLILPETAEQFAFAARLPEGYAVAVDMDGTLWGWAPDGSFWEAWDAGPATD